MCMQAGSLSKKCGSHNFAVLPSKLVTHLGFSSRSTMSRLNAVARGHAVLFLAGICEISVIEPHRVRADITLRVDRRGGEKQYMHA